MPVEFIGHVLTKDLTETRPQQGPEIDRRYLERLARAHEEAGFDRILIGYVSTQADGLQVAAHLATVTGKVHFLVAHRPGFVFPTVAARAFATADQLSGGRIALHTISGAADAEQRREGDYLSKEDRYERTAEYLDILDRAWTASDPFDHHGTFYRFEDFVSDVRPVQRPRIPIYFGGSSAAAYRVGAPRADVYALWAEPLAQTAEQIAQIRAAARAAGRTEPPRINVSFRPILGATDELAWARAAQILSTVQRRFATTGDPLARFAGTAVPVNVGSQRQLANARLGERHDRALWTEVAAATGAVGQTTALVGTPETVAEALLDYVDLGVDGFLLRGFDPYDDVIDLGRTVLPQVRRIVREREASGAPAALASAARATT